MPRDNNLLGLISNYALDRLTIPQHGRCSTSVSLLWCVLCQTIVSSIVVVTSSRSQETRNYLTKFPMF